MPTALVEPRKLKLSKMTLRALSDPPGVEVVDSGSPLCATYTCPPGSQFCTPPTMDGGTSCYFPSQCMGCFTEGCTQ